jgi:hypothetical protein
VVERRHALDGAEGELRGEREIARIEPGAAGLSVQRAVGPGFLLEHATHDRVRARTRGCGTALGFCAGWSVVFLHASLYASRFFCLALSVVGRLPWCARMRAAAAPQDRRCRAASNSCPDSGSILKVESGLFAALFVDARTFVQKSSSGINFFR